MIRSMTGFGRAEAAMEEMKVIVEIKTVNHRNMELIVRLPGSLSPLELNVRKIIQEKIHRGRVEAVIRTESAPKKFENIRIEANIPLIVNYLDVLKEIKGEFDIKDDVNLAMITGLRDAIIFDEDSLNLDNVWEEIEKALDIALHSLLEMRSEEGCLLSEELSSRLELLEGSMNAVRERSPQIVSEYREKLSKRIAELTEGIEIDETRLIQEVAIMAEKSDITEELVRLQSHITQFREHIDRGGPIGKKLDFLLQEMHREVNTLGSKSNDIAISHNVIEMKTEVAKLREQIQNVE